MNMKIQSEQMLW